jgi:hypothetical protein
MRTREKLTLEEKFSLALELIKRERSLDEIRLHYRVSHTTAYKIRNTFLEGGRAALIGERKARHAQDLEARVSALEAVLRNSAGNGQRQAPARFKSRAIAVDGDGLLHERHAGK